MHEHKGKKNRLPENMTSREDALKKLFAVWTPSPETETVPLEDSVGRTLAETLTACFTLPLSHVAGCDGVAVKSAAFAAGTPDASGWRAGREYVRADTGDDFPDEYDAVVMVEDLVFLPEGGLRFDPELSSVRPGENVRPAGSAQRAGDELLAAGRVIRPTDLSALAAGGVTEVPVRKKPVIAFLPTGSELIPAGQSPARGQNIDSNSPMVAAMLREMGAEPKCYPITRDAPRELEATLRAALGEADVVVINGGSSKGGEDFNTGLLADIGDLLFHEVSAAPGRPMAIALVGGKPVVNLPGPPLAAYFGTDWCIRAIVDRALGRPAAARGTLRGVLTGDLGPGGPLEILHRIRVSVDDGGEVALTPINGRRAGSAAVMTGEAQYVTAKFEEKHPAGSVLEVTLLP